MCESADKARFSQTILVGFWCRENDKANRSFLEHALIQTSRENRQEDFQENANSRFISMLESFPKGM